MGFARSARAWIEKHRLRNQITKLLSNREKQTILIACSSVYVRVVPARSNMSISSATRRGRGIRGTLSDVVLGSWVLSFVWPSSVLSIDSKLTWLLLVDSARNDGTFASPSPCKQTRLTTSPVRKYGSSKTKHWLLPVSSGFSGSKDARRHPRTTMVTHWTPGIQAASRLSYVRCSNAERQTLLCAPLGLASGRHTNA